MAKDLSTGFDNDELTESGAVFVEVQLPGTTEPVRLQTRFPWIGSVWDSPEEDFDDFDF